MYVCLRFRFGTSQSLFAPGMQVLRFLGAISGTEELPREMF